GTRNSIVGCSGGLTYGSALSYCSGLGYGALGGAAGDHNIGVGVTALANQSGSYNIVIGDSIAPSATSASNELNIGGVLFATGLYGTTARKVGIGAQAPAAQLDVDTGGDLLGVRVKRATSTSDIVIQSWVSNVGGTNTTVATMDSDGDLVKLSDRSLKDQILPATPKLDDLMKIEIVNYTWKGDQSGKKNLGMIAQQVETVFPGLIRLVPTIAYRPVVEWTPFPGETWSDRPENAPEDWQPCPAQTEADRPNEAYETGEYYRAVSQDVFVPILIKALQELHARHQVLIERVAVLENA
ncbi:MAG: tail fiber domain-containing protein, partial [Magnetococcus sp. YQC-9]